MDASRDVGEDQMSDVEIKIKEIIAKEVSIDPSEITRDSTMEDLKIESIDLVQIMFAIEEEFDIYLADQDVGFDIKNVGQVVDAVEKLVAGKSPDEAAPTAAES